MAKRLFCVLWAKSGSYKSRFRMALKEYRRKRDFARTPEPAGAAAAPAGKAPIFDVQAHAARKLHYDFRLEMGGVLKSWAVPKGPSLDPGEKRLAVHVEDHPLDYGAFEGVIPKGQYGGGTVMVWDHGWWEPVGDPAAGFAKGDFKFILHGEKLRGRWVLVRIRGRRGETVKADNWLLIKERDAEARPGSGNAVVATSTTSAVTGRAMAAIGLGVNPGVLPGAKRAKALPKLAPQLAATAGLAPMGDEWLHEIKFDGYRMLATVAHGKARLLSRNDLD
jgi:bifunctional non-homologous end joining protein LigD